MNQIKSAENVNINSMDYVYIETFTSITIRFTIWDYLA